MKKPHELECPVCKSQLISHENKNYMTWADDIADPNGEMSDYKNRPTLICSNKECFCGREKIIGFWDFMGDWYWERWVDEDNKKLIKHLANENMTALWASSRTIFGEKEKRSPYLNLYWVQFYIKWDVKCEPKYGNPVGIKNLKLMIVRRDKDGHYLQYTSGFSMLKYYIKKFYKAKKAYKTREYSPDAWYVKEIRESFCPPSLCKTETWHFKLFSWYINTFEKKTYSSIHALELLAENENQRY